MTRTTTRPPSSATALTATTAAAAATAALLVLLLAPAAARGAADAPCYDPTGGRADGYYPCDPGAFITLCCPQGWTCFSNGMCGVTTETVEFPNLTLGDAMRGMCTNPKWSNSICGDYCLDSQDKDGGLAYCGDNQFCCLDDYDAGSCSCASGGGAFLVSPGVANTIIDATESPTGGAAFSTAPPPTATGSSSPPSSATSSPTTTASSASSPSSPTSPTTTGPSPSSSSSSLPQPTPDPSPSPAPSNNNVALKAGLGAGLGGAAAIAIGILVWAYVKYWHHPAEEAAVERGGYNNDPAPIGTAMQEHLAQNDSGASGGRGFGRRRGGYD